MAAHGGPNIVDNGLVLHLDAANEQSYAGSGTSWYDLSRNGYEGTLSNGPTYSSDNGGSIEFDGTDDYHDLRNLSLIGLTGITVSVMYYADGWSTALFRGNNNSFILHYIGAGFYLKTSDSAVSGYLRWSPHPPSQRWNMLTGTWDGTTMKLYLNGVKQTNELSFTGNGTLFDITIVQLGYYFNTSQPYTNGKISTASIYNRALTDDEIKQNFSALRGRYGI